MSAVLVDESGAQILPHVGDEQARVSSWFAVLACSADMRAKNPEWMALARSLRIEVSA